MIGGWIGEVVMVGMKAYKRISMVVFLEILSVPQATSERQWELRELDKWLRNYCQRRALGL